MAYSTFVSASRICSAAAWRRVCTASGEPSGVQMAAYFAADFAGRLRSTMPCRIGSQTKRGSRTTRGSERNSAR